MTKYFFTLLLAVATVCTQAQNVGIGTTTPSASAALEVTGNNKGLLIPRTSIAGRTAIAAPAKGLMVYDTTHSAFFYYDGGTWRPFYEKNYDSATVDYSSSAVYGTNLPTQYGASTYIFPSTGYNSGFIYDNGGPAGNYNANSFSYAYIDFNYNTIQIKLSVEEMNAETFYDSLFIIQYSEATSNFTDTIAKFTGTQTGTVYITNAAVVFFKSNSINHFAGFKIRWGEILPSPTLQISPPLYGWHFNNEKLAAMGGNQRLNNWHTDSVGYGSISYGIGSKAKGNSSISFGGSAQAIGHNSTAIGLRTKALGYGSTAFGSYTTANQTYSTAMGFETFANSYRATAMGSNTYATGYASLVAGIYNDSILSRQENVTSSTPLFIIGNGNNNADRTNAFVVFKNGNVAIGDNNNPVNKLQITGAITNVGLGDNTGMMTLGYTSSTNMVIDQNDIQVRQSGAASDLSLQRLGGNIGIGNTGVPAYQLELSTNSAGKPGTNTWTIASDRRLKQDINPYTQGLQQLMQINPVTYHYNEKSGFDTKPEYVGIIAQDLQQIAPYMVSTVKRKDADYLGVDNGAMTYMLINALKEQQAIIEALKKRIEVLEKK